MSAWGEVIIECDEDGCHATHAIEANDLIAVAGREYLEDENWAQVDGRYICPQCQAEANPREPGDDDGREYADPRDYRAGLE